MDDISLNDEQKEVIAKLLVEASENADRPYQSDEEISFYNGKADSFEDLLMLSGMNWDGMMELVEKVKGEQNEI